MLVAQNPDAAVQMALEAKQAQQQAAVEQQLNAPQEPGGLPPMAPNEPIA